MKLIPIADNVLVNPDHIGCIEQRKVKNRTILFIYVDGVEYEYEYEDKVPIGDFLNIIQMSENKQFFAG